MPWRNCELTLNLDWSESCPICEADKVTTFAMTRARLYLLVVTILTQDNAKLLQQLNWGFKRTINWNKNQPKISTEAQNRYFGFLINTSFQGVNRLFDFFLKK